MQGETLGAERVGCGRWDARGGERLRWSAGKDGLGVWGLERAAARVWGRQPLGAGSRGIACGGSKSLMSGPWLSSSRSRSRRAWRGDHGGLSLPEPARLCSRFRPRIRGGARLKPTAHRDAPGSAELPSHKRTARAMPPRVLVLALPGGHPGRVAEHLTLQPR